MKILAAHATGPKTIRLGLDSKIDPANLNYAFTALDSPAVSVRSIRTDSQGPTLQIILDQVMTSNIRYHLVVTDTSQLIRDEVTLLGYAPTSPRDRQFQLWSMLPRHNLSDDVSGDLHRFMSCLQDVLDGLLVQIDQLSDLFDLERCPESWIDRILYDLGNPFHFELAPIEKRRLASVLVGMYREKGTSIGIENAIRFFIGVKNTVRPWAHDTLTLGHSELGEDWALGATRSSVRYAFDVQVTEILNSVQRRQIRTLVEYLKPAHTRFAQLLEPIPPPLLLHWELGLSELGETTRLH